MDAWDLVMRVLSHYWRVTRQDNMVAQVLLEKATAIDPNYGQALGVLAASHVFCAHMGWPPARPFMRPVSMTGDKFCGLWNAEYALMLLSLERVRWPSSVSKGGWRRSWRLMSRGTPG
jgi:hypothetical protein